MTLEFLQQELLKVGGVSFTPLGLLTALVSFVLVFVFAILVSRLLARGLSKVAIVEEGERYAISRIAYYLILIFGALACLEGLGIAIGRPFLTLGGTSISLFSLSTFFALSALVLVGSQIAGRAVANTLLNKAHFDEGLRYAIGRITYYVLLVTGMMAALQTIGVQLGSITVLIGALGVGIGFGLQNI
ncbi:MAG: mechanosensitive ion channel, partial [Candidatus Eremiobacteraeota bacterium]|nr:mechanosensitive ion channel [Candidatus Eremiobacteraeota bacterium]